MLLMEPLALVSAELLPVNSPAIVILVLAILYWAEVNLRYAEVMVAPRGIFRSSKRKAEVTGDVEKLRMISSVLVYTDDDIS